MVEALRHEPSDAILADVAERDVVSDRVEVLERDVVGTAKGLLAGEIARPGAQSVRPRRPFAPEDVSELPEDWQLSFYGFGAPRLYLEAYEQTGAQQFLLAARDYLLAWRKFERAQWEPKGLLWNDHAIAQRAQVLIKFWLRYRNSPIFAASDAKAILEIVTREGAMLSDPSLYTFRTNHGVMQNLELLQLRLGFPALPLFSGLAEIARDRLKSQIAHYTNDEGTVLEHSAGYHAFGLMLFGNILRDYSLLGMPIPTAWKDRYHRMLQVFAELRRPDSTLPTWGDTAFERFVDPPSPAALRIPEIATAPPDWRPGMSSVVLPGGGIAVWWQGLENWPASDRLSQTFVTWSYYPPLGHKRPDELSFILWARGRPWWTSEGYIVRLPTGAVSDSDWDGSNAPHLVGEAWNNSRRSRLLGFTSTEALKAIELERETDDGFFTRRLLVQLGTDCWVSVDIWHDAKARTMRTVWLADPHLTLSDIRGPNATLLNPINGDELNVQFLAERPLEPKVLQGNISPFIGWVESQHDAAPSTALVLEEPSAAGWTANVSMIHEKGALPSIRMARMETWRDPEHWDLIMSGADGDLRLTRDGMTILEGFPDGRAVAATLAPGDDPGPMIAAVMAAYRADLERYGGPLRELWDYRVRISLVLLTLFLLQQTVLMGVGRWAPILRRTLEPVTLVGWCMVGAWLWLVYF